MKLHWKLICFENFRFPSTVFFWNNTSNHNHHLRKAFNFGRNCGIFPFKTKRIFVCKSVKNETHFNILGCRFVSLFGLWFGVWVSNFFLLVSFFISCRTCYRNQNCRIHFRKFERAHNMFCYRENQMSKGLCVIAITWALELSEKYSKNSASLSGHIKIRCCHLFQIIKLLLFLLLLFNLKFQRVFFSSIFFAYYVFSLIPTSYLCWFHLIFQQIVPLFPSLTQLTRITFVCVNSFTKLAYKLNNNTTFVLWLLKLNFASSKWHLSCHECNFNRDEMKKKDWKSNMDEAPTKQTK